MTIGGKYKWKPDSNPPVGAYDVDQAIIQTKPTIPSAIITKNLFQKKAPEQSPAPGEYDGHLKDFGYNTKNMTIGGKYVWKPDSNPPVGAYNIE